MLRRITIVAAIFSLSLTTVFRVHAQNSDPEDSSEYLIKAGFIYNFAKFVQWPQAAFAQPDSPIVIGILGTDPFGSMLDRVVAGKKIGGRSFVIRRLEWGKDAANLKECDILFVSSSERKHMADVVHTVKHLPVLTIGEAPGFAAGGGVIRFVIEDNRVRFEINVDAAHDAGLDISSRLLTLAKIVSQAPANGKDSQ